MHWRGFVRMALGGLFCWGTMAETALAGIWTIGRAPGDCPGGCNFDDFTLDGGDPDADGIAKCMLSVSVVSGDTCYVYPRPGVTGEDLCLPENSFSARVRMKSGVTVIAALGPGSICVGGGGGGEVGIEFVNTSETTVVDGFRITWNASGTGVGGGVACFLASGVIRNCIFDRCVSGTGSGVYQFVSDVRVENNIFIQNRCDAGGGVIALSSSNPVVINNTIYRAQSQFAGQGSAMNITDSFPVVSKNIIYGSEGSPAVYCTGASFGTFDCNMFWANTFGTSGGSCSDVTGTNGNVHADPGFCDALANDFHVCSTSPAVTGPCGVIGYTPPTGFACANCPTPAEHHVETTSWGRLKSFYR